MFSGWVRQPPVSFQIGSGTMEATDAGSVPAGAIQGRAIQNGPAQFSGGCGDGGPLTGEKDQRKCQTLVIRYYDQFLRQENRWYFVERKLVIDWSDSRVSVPRHLRVEMCNPAICVTLQSSKGISTRMISSWRGPRAGVV